ncbi:hypothetical protein [Actinoplanes sp. NPDC051494]|uniref:hypothetical protein n=1 Tax=Actinoplanes sp. NPDC051494 TaxID=3363907 RepID=UPI0037B843F3
MPRQYGTASAPPPAPRYGQYGRPIVDEGPGAVEPEPRPRRRHAAPDTSTDLAGSGPEADAEQFGDHGYGLTTGGIPRDAARPRPGYHGTEATSQEAEGTEYWQPAANYAEAEPDGTYSGTTYGGANQSYEVGTYTYGRGAQHSAAGGNDDYDSSDFVSAGSYDYGGPTGYGYGRDDQEEQNRW